MLYVKNVLRGSIETTEKKIVSIWREKNFYNVKMKTASSATVFVKDMRLTIEENCGKESRH